MQPARAHAPGKIILFGEHAVVHGQPAIAVPVSSLRASVTVEPNPAGSSGLHIVASDLNQTLPYDLVSQSIDNALMLTVRLVLEHLGAEPPDVLLTVRAAAVRLASTADRDRTLEAAERWTRAAARGTSPSSYRASGRRRPASHRPARTSPTRGRRARRG